LVFTTLAAEEMVIALVEASDPARAGLEPAIAGSSLRRVAFMEKISTLQLIELKLPAVLSG
jgi:hypothetical protein